MIWKGHNIWTRLLRIGKWLSGHQDLERKEAAFQFPRQIGKGMGFGAEQF